MENDISQIEVISSTLIEIWALTQSFKVHSYSTGGWKNDFGIQFFFFLAFSLNCTTLNCEYY